MKARKFWIVEYVDVNAPKVERSEICASKREAFRLLALRNGISHYETLEDYAGSGFCDSLRNTHLFDNELRG